MNPRIQAKPDRPRSPEALGDPEAFLRERERFTAEIQAQQSGP